MIVPVAFLAMGSATGLAPTEQEIKSIVPLENTGGCDLIQTSSGPAHFCSTPVAEVVRDVSCRETQFATEVACSYNVFITDDMIVETAVSWEQRSDLFKITDSGTWEFVRELKSSRDPDNVQKFPSTTEMIGILPFGGHTCSESAKGPTDCLASMVMDVRDLNCTRTNSPERVACSYNALVEYFEGDGEPYWVQGVDMFELTLNDRWRLLHEIKPPQIYGDSAL